MNGYDPAFPCEPTSTGGWAPQGMTKREYVVVEMAKAIASNPAFLAPEGNNTGTDNWRIANLAVSLADTLLSAV